jgi:hypothetical protein
MMSFAIEAGAGDALEGASARFKFYRQLVELCRVLRLDVVYREADEVTERQFQNLSRAFELLRQSSIPLNGKRYLLRLGRRRRGSVRCANQLPRH